MINDNVTWKHYHLQCRSKSSCICWRIVDKNEADVHPVLLTTTHNAYGDFVSCFCMNWTKYSQALKGWAKDGVYTKDYPIQLVIKLRRVLEKNCQYSENIFKWSPPSPSRSREEVVQQLPVFCIYYSQALYHSAWCLLSKKSRLDIGMLFLSAKKKRNSLKS